MSLLTVFVGPAMIGAAVVFVLLFAKWQDRSNP